MAIKEDYDHKYPNSNSLSKITSRADELAVKLFREMFDGNIEFPVHRSNDVYSKWFSVIQWLFLFSSGKISNKTLLEFLSEYISNNNDFSTNASKNNSYFEDKIKDTFYNFKTDFLSEDKIYKFESLLINDLENINYASELNLELYPDPEDIKLVKGNRKKYFHFLVTLSMITVLNKQGIGKLFTKIIYSPRFIAPQKSQFTSPRFLNELLARLVEPKDGDTVYDPAAGIGESLVACATYNPMIKISGAEIDPIIYKLAKMNFLLNKIPISDFVNEDSLGRNNQFDNLYDDAVCVPPFGADRQKKNITSKKSQSSEILFLELILKKIKPGGRVGILMPTGFLINSNLEQYRKEFINEVTLRLIISIPFSFFLPNMGVETTLVVFEKRKGLPNEKCLIIDGKILSVLGDQNKTKPDRPLEAEAFIDEIENLYKSSKRSKSIPNQWIDQSELITSISNWSPSRFINDSFKIENQFILKGSELATLGELVKHVPYKNPDFNSEIPFITTRHLKTDPSFPFLNADLIQDKLKYWGQQTNTQIIDSEALLLSLKWNFLKPTLFQPEKGAISIKKGDLIALNVNEDLVIPQYLVFQLNSDYVREQLKSISKGTEIKYITQGDLFQIKIPLPSLNEQKDFLAKRNIIQKEKSILADFIDQIKLYENYSDQKKELERFASSYFTDSQTINYMEKWEFEVLPYKHAIVENEEGIYHDIKQNTYYLIIHDDKDPLRGILKIANCYHMEVAWYKEINSYANFLFKVSDFLSKSAANSQLATFAHTSKNFFASLQADILAIIKSPNTNLIQMLSKAIIDTPEFIKRKVSQGKAKPEDYIALNKLHQISKKVASFADFYQKTSSIFKGLIEQEIIEFDLMEVLRSADINGCCNICSLENEKIMVLAKKQPISHAIADLLLNAHKYSLDNKYSVEVINKEMAVEIIIKNEVDAEKIISADKYNKLGREWLTKVDGDGASSGVYWAFRAVNDSLGEITILPYKEYTEKQEFLINIKLRKKYE
jgi:type I restriction-modification system DNA methylase subunit